MNRTARRKTGTHGVHVRMATEMDAPGIARIYNHYIDGGGTTFDTTHWTTEQVARLLAGPKPEGWLVAMENAALIGWASARLYSMRHGYRFTCETAIYVDPNAIGSGVADLLQRRLEEHCRQCGIHHAVARIIASNERSMAFHRRFGYELVGIQREIGRVAEKWTDVAILQKILEEQDPSGDNTLGT